MYGSAVPASGISTTDVSTSTTIGSALLSPEIPRLPCGSGVRVRWTAEETELLVKLVGEYGKKWSKIYDTSPSFWMRNGRSQVDLKDKFRNLAKKQRI